MDDKTFDMVKTLIDYGLSVSLLFFFLLKINPRLKLLESKIQELISKMSLMEKSVDSSKNKVDSVEKEIIKQNNAMEIVHTLLSQRKRE